MTRWAATATLHSVEVAVRADGSTAETRTSRDVFVNARRTGATVWAAERSAGLHDDATVQLRSCDYAGEQELSMGGVAYEVERARNDGEFTVLTLKRRLRSDG